MKGYLSILGVFTLAVTAGCSGDFQSGNGNGIPIPDPVDAGVSTADAGEVVPVSSAESLFNANVRPIIMANCSPGGACHSSQDPAFVTLPENMDAAYGLIGVHKDRLYPNFNPTGAALLSYGDGAHKPQAVFSDDDTAQVQAWLAIEKMEADANGPVLSALQIWSGCMNLGDWNDENVASLWANKNAQGQGDCDACHTLGEEDYIASIESDIMFDQITRKPHLMPSYFTLNASGTEVVINRSRLENVGTLQEPHQAHGAFDVDGNAMEALVRFYDKTKQRQLTAENGGLPCDPPRY